MNDFGKAMGIIRFKTDDFEKLQLAISCLRFVSVHHGGSPSLDEIIKKLEFTKEATKELTIGKNK